MEEWPDDFPEFMTDETTRIILGRDEYEPRDKGYFGRAMITGAAGTIGQALSTHMRGEYAVSDIFTLDVATDQMWEAVNEFKPQTIFHLAADKHAPDGERLPWQYVRTNLLGVENVIYAADQVDARVVLASTCKACDPETVYGATKLIAERACLEYGHSVARLYNVYPASGNVFETWRDTPDDEPIRVMPCTRRFVSLKEAVGLFLYAANHGPGRYTIFPTIPRKMNDIAKELYPDRMIERVFPRRGDRVEEPEMAARENLEMLPQEYHIVRIISSHDPRRAE